MAAFNKDTLKAWEEKEGPVVLTTISSDNIPNSIYATCVGLFEGRPVIADNYFAKTKANINSGGTASILFITKENKAYQAKGTLEYLESGPVFDSMKEWNPKEHPGHAAVIMNVEEIYSGADKLL